MAYRISNLAIRKCFLPANNLVTTQIIHKFNSTPVVRYADEAKPKAPAPANTEGRMKRTEPGKVVGGFIPIEWVDFFYEKTGVTGFYTFLVTFGCYLVSKEHYVLNHDYYEGCSMLLCCIYATKKMGPGIAKSLDKEVDQYETDWNKNRENEKKMLAEGIEDEKLKQKQSDVNLQLVAAQREAIAIQQETEYRQRFMKVYKEVMQRLNYQTKLALIRRHYIQKNLLDWIQREVLKVITPEWNNKYVDECINVLEKIPK